MKKLICFFLLSLFLGCSIPKENLVEFVTEDFFLLTPVALTRNTEIEQQSMDVIKKTYGQSIDVKLYTGSGNDCMLAVSSTNYHSKLTKDNLTNGNVGNILNIDKTQPIEDIISHIKYHTENNILYSVLEYSLIKKGYYILVNSKSCIVNEQIHSVLITCKDSQENKALSSRTMESFWCK